MLLDKSRPLVKKVVPLMGYMFLFCFITSLLVFCIQMKCQAQYPKNVTKIGELRCVQEIISGKNISICAVPYFYLNRNTAVRLTPETMAFANNCFQRRDTCPDKYVHKTPPAFKDQSCDRIAPYQALFVVCYSLDGIAKYVLMGGQHVRNETEIQKLQLLLGLE
ncbi:MAG: hypothetical protein GY853_00930 [PVC group bacterium]|nr:hypothetical protein [PVC group bacterium]